MRKKENGVFKAFVMVTQVGISMMTPIFLGGALGWYLDHKFFMKCWFIIGLLLGIIAAFRNVYYLTKQFYAKDLKKEQEELEYFESLKKSEDKK